MNQPYPIPALTAERILKLLGRTPNGDNGALKLLRSIILDAQRDNHWTTERAVNYYAGISDVIAEYRVTIEGEVSWHKSVYGDYNGSPMDINRLLWFAQRLDCDSFARNFELN